MTARFQVINTAYQGEHYYDGMVKDAANWAIMETDRRVVSIQIYAGTTSVATGDGQAYFRVPSALNAMNLVAVAAACVTAGTTGTMDIQIANVTDAVDMLTTKITIDSTETDSSTAATPAVIDTTKDDVVTGDMLRIDIDAIHSGTAAKGLIVEMQFWT
jgi:hypothetical protein